MDQDNCKLFDRVAKKLGWMEMGGLDVAEEKVGCVNSYPFVSRIKWQWMLK